MKTNHTPGPWTGAPWETSYLIPHGSADGAWGVCEAGGGDMVAHVADDRPDAEAVARLIAEAPAMYAALDALFEHCAMVHARWGDGSNQHAAAAAIAAGRATLARVKGEA